MARENRCGAAATPVGRRGLSRAIACLLMVGGLTAVAGAIVLDLPSVRRQGPFFPPCSIPVRTGKPCPACGYRRAFTAAAHFRFCRAWRLQPGAAVLSGTLALALAWAAWVLLTGRDPLGLERRLIPVMLLSVAYVLVVVLTGWALGLNDPERMHRIVDPVSNHSDRHEVAAVSSP
jgi:hypothetical protein